VGEHKRELGSAMRVDDLGTPAIQGGWDISQIESDRGHSITEGGCIGARSQGFSAANSGPEGVPSDSRLRGLQRLERYPPKSRKIIAKIQFPSERSAVLSDNSSSAEQRSESKAKWRGGTSL